MPEVAPPPPWGREARPLCALHEGGTVTSASDSRCALPLPMAAALKASFDASHAAYLARLAAGKQPLPPAAVRSVASGALSFLDYTNDAALARINANYLLVVALLYIVMRRRGSGFELRWLMIVRFTLCRLALASLAPRVRLAAVPWHVCYAQSLRARAI